MGWVHRARGSAAALALASAALACVSGLGWGCNAAFGVSDLRFEEALGGGPAASGVGASGGATASCDNGARDGDEEGVDCGGPCPSCEAPLGELGAPCEMAAQCASGHCPAGDGVCCDTRCDLTCEACVETKTGAADGLCRLVPAKLDPDAECPSEDVATCGSNGDGCSGTSTSCVLFEEGRVCEAAVCRGGVARSDATCDGSGHCLSPTETSCAPYTCDANSVTCRTSCLLESDCVSTHYCNLLLATCTPKGGAGAPCSAAKHCLSGVCNTALGVCA